MRDLCEADDPAQATRDAKGQSLGKLDAILANTPPETRDIKKPWLLAPVDLQALEGRGRHLRHIDARTGDRGDGHAAIRRRRPKFAPASAS